MLTFNSKDFLEKYITFADKDKCYIYFTAVPSSFDDEEVATSVSPFAKRDSPPKTDRAATVLGV